jgi:hypothetical protein
MPRFKPKGMLERDALADLWKHTLSQIPSVYGRLAYLASLRDPNSGAYRHHGLSAAFGREQSTYALRTSHEQTFLEWLNLSLAGKNTDFRAYFQSVSLGENPQAVIRYLAPGARYVTQAPDPLAPPNAGNFTWKWRLCWSCLRTIPAMSGFQAHCNPRNLTNYSNFVGVCVRFNVAIRSRMRLYNQPAITHGTPSANIAVAMLKKVNGAVELAGPPRGCDLALGIVNHHQ